MKVHLSGVGGTAMASLAGLLLARSDEVTGSDQDVYPPMSTQLEELGVRVLTPYAEANVSPGADLVVIGNALSRGNPEVEVVLDRRQPMTSMAAFLGEQFISGHRSLVVAGTHGKTTTASLAAYLLESAGRDPSYLVGGIPIDMTRSYRLGGGEHFVIEGDEYDCAFFDKRPKFVHYRPDVAIIGNLEFDHADIYRDLEAVQTAFSRLISVIPRGGTLLAGDASPALVPLLEKAHCRVESFGLDPSSTWRATELSLGGEGSGFRLLGDDRDYGLFRFSMAGGHNVRNAVGALAMLARAGVEPSAVREALGRFKGVRRRLELRGNADGVAVYDDFAHHPTAVRATLETLRRRVDGGGRLVAVFEPRSFTSSTNVFQRELGLALGLADVAIVAPAFRVDRVAVERRLDPRRLVADAAAAGADARVSSSVAEIVSYLGAELRAGDQVAILSNGGFDRIHERLLDALGSR